MPFAHGSPQLPPSFRLPPRQGQRRPPAPPDELNAAHRRCIAPFQGAAPPLAGSIRRPFTPRLTRPSKPRPAIPVRGPGGVGAKRARQPTNATDVQVAPAPGAAQATRAARRMERGPQVGRGASANGNQLHRFGRQGVQLFDIMPLVFGIVCQVKAAGLLMVARDTRCLLRRICFAASRTE